jgi:hypothetical protein
MSLATIKLAATPKPYLGRCKDCDYALFAAPEQVKQAEGWRDVTALSGPYRVGNYGVYARCGNGHKVFQLRAIKGTYSEKHTCDSRCLNAKGHDCTCSCGGINHGRGHAAEMIAAPTETKGLAAIAASADRNQGHVVRVEAEPTEPQLALIAKLAEKLESPYDMPVTRSEASELINSLKAAERLAAPQMSDPQRSFINSLMEQRSMSLESRQEARRQIDAGLTRYEASRWIDKLQTLPEIN